jgi:Zn-dependent protease with chaperone function
MADQKRHFSAPTLRDPALLCGIPLGLMGMALVLSLVYREELMHAGLYRFARYVAFLVPMAVLALLVAVGAYRNLRDSGTGDGEPVPRSRASKVAISTVLLLVGFPLVPATVLHFRSEQGFDFTTVILIGACVAGVQFVWPMLLVFNLDRDHEREGELRTRIQSLAETAGVHLEDIVVAAIEDDEDDEGSPFAFACGLGRSRRVVIGGQMAQMLEPEELDAIVAHECAHVSERHIAKKIIVIFALAMGFVALDLLPEAETLWGMLLLGVAFLLCIPIKLAFDRRFEVTADRLAADWAGPRQLRDALSKLATCDEPSRLPSWLATHPPMAERIRVLEERMAE